MMTNIINRIKQAATKHLKLYHATLLLIPLILGLTFGFPDNEHHRSIYVPLSIGTCSFLLFMNFPNLVVFLHTRPIYYDDLVIKDFNDDDARKFYDDTFHKKYQRIFKTVIAITSSLLVVGTSELWFFRDKLFNTGNAADTSNNKLVTNFVIIGVIGGILRIYYTTTLFIGKLVMFILRYVKKREQEQLRMETHNRIKQELELAGIDMHEDDDELLSSDSENQQETQIKKIVSFKPTLMTDIFN